MSCVQLNHHPSRLTGQIKPIEDESFQSLIARSLSASGFPYAPHALEFQFQEPHHWYRATAQQDLNTADLADLLNLPQNEINKRRHTPRDTLVEKGRPPFFSRPVAWRKTVFDGRLLSYRQRRQPARMVCGVGRHLPIWSIKSVDFCLKSGEPLVDSCISCGTALGWLHVDFETCHKCGERLSCRQVKPVSQAHLRTLRDIYALLGPDAQDGTKITTRLGFPFNELEPGELFVAVLELVFLNRLTRMTHTERRQTKFPSIRSVSLTEMAQAWQQLNELDDYLLNFLSGFPEPLRTASIKKQFDPLPRFITPKLKSPLAFILLKRLPDVVAQRWPGCTMSSAGILAPVAARATSGVLSQTGVSRKRLSALDTDPEAMIARSAGPKGWKTYNESRVREVLEKYRASISMDDISWRYGIYNHLVEGVMDTLSLFPDNDRLTRKIARGEWRFDESQLRCSLSDCIWRGTTGSTDALPIKDLMSGIIDPNWWYALVQALIDRKIKCTNVDEELNFNASLISNSEFEYWLACTKIEPSADLEKVCISAQPAAYICGMSQGTIVSAIKQGVLPAEFRKGQWAITLKDLQKLLNKYSHLGEVALGSTWHRPFLAKTLESRGLYPAVRLTGATLWDRELLHAQLIAEPDLFPRVMVERIAPSFPRECGHVPGRCPVTV